MDPYSKIHNDVLRTIFTVNPFRLGIPSFAEKPYKDGLFSCVLFGVRPCGTNRILGLGVASTAAQARVFSEDAAFNDLIHTEGYQMFLDEYVMACRTPVELPGVIIDFIVPTKVEECYADVFENTIDSFPQ